MPSGHIANCNTCNICYFEPFARPEKFYILENKNQN